MVLETVKKMIANQLKVDESQVVEDARLVEDLGADSANIMVLIMDLEDEYNMQVDDSAITELKTVGDIAKYIEKVTQE
ncbi:MAG: acyl carrier protein [Christensenellales bacterium]|jgi:acyl carrier protein